MLIDRSSQDALRKIQADRVRSQKLRDASLHCFDFIENEDEQGLMKYLSNTSEIGVHEIYD